MSCPCSAGAMGGYPYGFPFVSPSVASVGATSTLASVGALSPNTTPIQVPPVQLASFEPAFFHSGLGDVFAVLPYSPSTAAVVTPQFGSPQAYTQTGAYYRPPQPQILAATSGYGASNSINQPMQYGTAAGAGPATGPSSGYGRAGHGQARARPPAGFAPSPAYTPAPSFPPTSAPSPSPSPGSASGGSGGGGSSGGGGAGGGGNGGGGGGGNPGNTTQTQYYTPLPGIFANECGCCRNAYSPLPPAAVEAWRQLIYDNAAPYMSVMPCAQSPLW